MNHIREYASELNVELNDEMIKSFELYYDLLVEKNKVMNLTAITDEEEVVQKHFVDSLAIYAAVPEFKDYVNRKNTKLLDLGTGAGFPGIPLKIAFPDTDVTLMDSLGKRIRFLDEVIDSLELKGIRAYHARAEYAAFDNSIKTGDGEDVKNVKLRGNFDLVVSRAVAKIDLLSELSLAFVKKNGYFIAYKAVSVDEELADAEAAIKKMGGTLCRVDRIVIPGLGQERSFVVIKKTADTPKKYPSKPGK